MSDLLESMNKLALAVADAAALEATQLQEKIDALKALTPYYAMLQKHRVPEEDSSELTFGELQAQITEAPNGATVHDRRGKRDPRTRHVRRNQQI
jgi:hypothetical protein